GSLGCLLATDVWTFLLFRTIQAAIVSGFALSRVIIRDTEPAQKAAGLMGYRADVGPDVRRGARSTFWLARELHRLPCLWRGSACLVLVRSWRDQQKS